MKKHSKLRHSHAGVEDGLDRLIPATDEAERCTAKGCPYKGVWSVVRLRGVFLCFHHSGELKKLARQQGEDWSKDKKDVGQIRLWKATKRGYHAY